MSVMTFMKQLLSLAILMGLAACNVRTPDFLIPHQCANGKYGYVDVNGKEWIEGSFDAATEFSENLAAVCVGGYWGYIDKEGEMVIPLLYSDAQPFSAGRAMVAKEGLYGYIDKNNQVIIPFLYDKIQPFSESEAFAYKDKRVGIIDPDGKVLVPLEYDRIEKLNEHLYAVTRGRFVGFLNAQKEELLPCKYNYTTMEDKTGKPLIRLRMNTNPRIIYLTNNGDKFGLMDMQGNILAPCKYDALDNFGNNNLARVKRDDKYGFIDANGKEIILPMYDAIWEFPESNRMVLRSDGICSFVDYQTGQPVTSQRFQDMSRYNDNLFKVELNDKLGMIDLDGNYVLEPIYSQMHVNMDGFLELLIENGGEVFNGMASKEDAKLLIPCGRYVSIKSFELGGGEYAVVVVEDEEYSYLRGLVNRQGKEVLPCKYFSIYTVENGKCMVVEPRTNNKRKWVKLNE